jgi:hypothetical protein
VALADDVEVADLAGVQVLEALERPRHSRSIASR